jgi:hypothetical protein
MTTLAQMYGTFRHAAWRYEGRDTYAVTGEEERIATFLRGEVLPRKTRENNGWIATVEDILARQAQIGRVRVVGHPLTDYTRFEFTAYPDNVRAGEDVAVIERALLSPEWDRVPDFWLFDEETVFVQFFDAEGSFIGAEQADDVAPFVEIRRLLQERATPLSRYELDDVPRQRVDSPIGPPPELQIPAAHC